MAKSVAKSSAKANSPKRILITQPKPENEKSPYFELERKHNLELVFQPFIKLEGIHARDFRKQKIDINYYTAVIFTSKNAIDHFFRICEEMKININQDTKYFCITEAVALYLQKFILYRKRKVFYGADSTNKSLFEVINKHKNNEKFLYVCSENQQDNEIVNWLKKNDCEFALGFMYRTISNDVSQLMNEGKFDAICFFTPSGIKSLLDNMPGFKQGKMIIGTFGGNTKKAAEDAGFNVDISAPEPKSPSMAAAIDQYFGELSKK